MAIMKQKEEKDKPNSKDDICTLKYFIKRENEKINQLQIELAKLKKEHKQLLNEQRINDVENIDEGKFTSKQLKLALLKSIKSVYNIQVTESLRELNYNVANQMNNLLKGIENKNTEYLTYKIAKHDFDLLNNLIEIYIRLANHFGSISHKSTLVNELVVPESKQLQEYFIAMKLLLNDLYCKINFMDKNVERELNLTFECFKMIESHLHQSNFQLKECFKKLYVYELIN
ncbi:hypothetical protein H312_02673 [Anncaliia algerae PRA339]|uniref:Uncharacterized protein n=1 Tax=Anncaliia algerae PRA339 TaxID=1288291 RepID=A0A059EYC5_9MICR|nr:hypothetical protein H312_02673 [Anncaliia algerae PRA339]